MADAHMHDVSFSDAIMHRGEGGGAAAENGSDQADDNFLNGYDAFLETADDASPLHDTPRHEPSSELEGTQGQGSGGGSLSEDGGAVVSDNQGVVDSNEVVVKGRPGVESDMQVCGGDEIKLENIPEEIPPMVDDGLLDDAIAVELESFAEQQITALQASEVCTQPPFDDVTHELTQFSPSINQSVDALLMDVNNEGMSGVRDSEMTDGGNPAISLVSSEACQVSCETAARVDAAAAPAAAAPAAAAAAGAADGSNQPASDHAAVDNDAPVMDVSDPSFAMNLTSVAVPAVTGEVVAMATVASEVALPDGFLFPVGCGGGLGGEEDILAAVEDSAVDQLAGSDLNEVDPTRSQRASLSEDSVDGARKSASGGGLGGGKEGGSGGEEGRKRRHEGEVGGMEGRDVKPIMRLDASGNMHVDDPKRLRLEPGALLSDISERESRLKYIFRSARFFVMKSVNYENIAIAKHLSVWATPPANEARLNQAFRECNNVILVFSIVESGRFQGFARLASEAERALAPVRWVLPPGLRGRAFNTIFRLDWISRHELAFGRTLHLMNPWNKHRPVKIGRDGQEVEPAVGEALCRLFPPDPNVDLRAIARVAKARLRSKVAQQQQQGGSVQQQQGRSMQQQQEGRAMQQQGRERSDAPPPGPPRPAPLPQVEGRCYDDRLAAVHATHPYEHRPALPAPRGGGLEAERLGQRLGTERPGQRVRAERLGQGEEAERLGQRGGAERMEQRGGAERMEQGGSAERLGQRGGAEQMGQRGGAERPGERGRGREQELEREEAVKGVNVILPRRPADVSAARRDGDTERRRDDKSGRERNREQEQAATNRRSSSAERRGGDREYRPARGRSREEERPRNSSSSSRPGEANRYGVQRDILLNGSYSDYVRAFQSASSAAQPQLDPPSSSQAPPPANPLVGGVAPPQYSYVALPPAPYDPYTLAAAAAAQYYTTAGAPAAPLQGYQAPPAYPAPPGYQGTLYPGAPYLGGPPAYDPYIEDYLRRAAGAAQYPPGGAPAYPYPAATHPPPEVYAAAPPYYPQDPSFAGRYPPSDQSQRGDGPPAYHDRDGGYRNEGFERGGAYRSGDSAYRPSDWSMRRRGSREGSRERHDRR